MGGGLCQGHLLPLLHSLGKGGLPAAMAAFVYPGFQLPSQTLCVAAELRGGTAWSQDALFLGQLQGFLHEDSSPSRGPFLNRGLRTSRWSRASLWWC